MRPYEIPLVEADPGAQPRNGDRAGFRPGHGPGERDPGREEGPEAGTSRPSPPGAPKVKRWTAADILLIAGVLALAATLWLAKPSPHGASVTIQTQDAPAAIYPLDRDATIAVTGPHGKTVIVIQSGKAFVRSSPCPDQICRRMGPISHAGEAIVCVPNHVSVRIDGQGKTDAVSY